jgi:hypothetical protein
LSGDSLGYTRHNPEMLRVLVALFQSVNKFLSVPSKTSKITLPDDTNVGRSSSQKGRRGRERRSICCVSSNQGCPDTNLCHFVRNSFIRWKCDHRIHSTRIGKGGCGDPAGRAPLNPAFECQHISSEPQARDITPGNLMTLS